jgi:hypothetical protein
VPPSIVSDVSAAVAKIAADVAANLAGIPPPPAIPSGGAFSPAAILAALEAAFEWAAQVAAATVKAAFDLVADTIAAVGTAVVDTVKMALWLAAKALYALYRAFRDVLMLRSYVTPYVDQLSVNFGGLAATSLWQSPGNTPSYPHEEILEERVLFPSSYVPTAVPTSGAELPGLAFIAPYAPTTTPAGTVVLALPDVFMDAPLGANMFAAGGPQKATSSGGVRSFGAARKKFGGALANSARGVDIAKGARPRFPNYNLDGDRTYAWPCWDVEPRPVAGQPPSAPLNPGDPAYQPAMIATVNAVLLR